MKPVSPLLFIPLLVGLSGLASLSWEGIWQVKASLALGVSSYGTALTLAVTMGGMGLGSFLMGGVLKRREPKNPLRLYGLLECGIGLCGLLLAYLFHMAEALDTNVYSHAPAMAPFAHIAGVAAALAVPALCMGATFPVIGLIARKYNKSLSGLYGLNTLGAAAGIVGVTFVLIPMLGILHAGFVISGINFLVGLATLVPVADGVASPQGKRRSGPSEIVYVVNLLCRGSSWLFDRGRAVTAAPELSAGKAAMIACATGFAVFALEIAWFRSLTATFQSTTYAFAIMLASVLLALGQAARLVALFKECKVSLGMIIAFAGTLILLATPLVDHLDLFLAGDQLNATDVNQIRDRVALDLSLALFQSSMVMLFLFAISYLIVGIPMIFLGIGFPWIVADKTAPREWGTLYAINTLSAIAGAIIAAWVMLPLIGFARTAWVVGAMVVIVGVLVLPDMRRRMAWSLAGLCALAIAVTNNSGVGRTRAQAAHSYGVYEGSQLLASYEGPSATVSVVEYKTGERRILIDGASASSQGGTNGMNITHYLNWMGSLPMLLHADPRNVLVICFGTGQTANAARKEGMESLDIVDIEKNVFKVAPLFTMNESVLTDPRVSPIVMDGRAYMRRVQKKYDVITLEPMPPNMAGVNALYSKEFYEHAFDRMNDGGVIAQWLPFNSLTPYYAASIARTFYSVFPNAILWIDPFDGEGILLGVKGDRAPIGTSWPGFDRAPVARNMSQHEIEQAVVLDPAKLAAYVEAGTVITDDNQLLAYGNNVRSVYTNIGYLRSNMDYFREKGWLAPEPQQ